jgi:hypothetical protein
MHLATSEARRGFWRPFQRAMPGPVLDPPSPHPAHQKRRRQRRNSVRERNCVACAPTGRTVDSCYMWRLQGLPDQKNSWLGGKEGGGKEEDKKRKKKER